MPSLATDRMRLSRPTGRSPLSPTAFRPTGGVTASSRSFSEQALPGSVRQRCAPKPATWEGGCDRTRQDVGMGEASRCCRET